MKSSHRFVKLVCALCAASLLLSFAPRSTFAQENEDESEQSDNVVYLPTIQSGSVEETQQVDSVDESMIPSLEILDAPSTIDEDWEVVSVETEVQDVGTVQQFGKEVAVTRVHTTTVRQSPEGYIPPEGVPDCFGDSVQDSEELQESFVKTGAQQSTGCQYQGATSRSDASSFYWGNDRKITSHLKHFAYKFCKGAVCTEYYKPNRLEIWWTRTDSDWSADYGYVTWGCTTCTKCDNSTWSHVWEKRDFLSARWKDHFDMTSDVHSLSVSWPAVHSPTSYGQYLKATVDSKVYEDLSHERGDLFVLAGCNN